MFLVIWNLRTIYTHILSIISNFIFKTLSATLALLAVTRFTQNEVTEKEDSHICD